MELNDLSIDQNNALMDLNDWMNSNIRSQYITLGGYAGTGKTTLISVFRSHLINGLNIAFLAFTGKAASILRNKLISSEGFIRPTDFVGTIHSFLYKPIYNDKHEIIKFEMKTSEEIPNIDLIVIDESSMVSEDTFNDLLSLGYPIICIGDHGQLPPVGNDNFNLMDNPNIKLETIHRYNEESDLLKLSVFVRYEGYIPYGRLGNSIIKTKLGDNLDKYVSIFSKLNNYTCLCGTNRNRILINKQFRRMLGLKHDQLQVKDKVICLKNNKRSRDFPIYNGMIGVVNRIKKFNSLYSLGIEFDSELGSYSGVCPVDSFHKNNQTISESDFNKQDLYFSFNYDSNLIGCPKLVDVFDYGYCITVHKSQGSEWDNVLLYEDLNSSMGDELYRRWLYTAVTRSRDKLIILGNDDE